MIICVELIFINFNILLIKNKKNSTNKLVSIVNERHLLKEYLKKWISEVMKKSSFIHH